MYLTLLTWDAVIAGVFFIFRGIELNFLTGLLIGTAAVCFNFKMLKIVVSSICTTNQKTYKLYLAIILHVVRLVIFLLTIYVSVKISILCGIGYSISIIGFMLITVITNLRGDEND